MGNSAGKISFDLSLDSEKMMSGISESCKKVEKKFKESFSNAAKQASKGVESGNDKIEEILKDTERSARSKAASIAALYKKEGYSSQEAFKKAWTHIERDSYSGSQKVKKHIKGISRQSDKTTNSMKANFLSFAKKAGAVIAGVFAVKKIVDFGKECVNLGSDLSEVQNVVDVTFPKMKARVNDFAKSAAGSFGLSETMAKKYTGAFGAMSKSFGFTEKEAYKMSTTLTGLAGDVASFYNMSQDEAYTKLKSVFTGETETLKDLGVVMTQNALDAYAMANGYGKVTAKMSEQEKVALRYKFVQDQLSAAAGDFIRTSDSWANQTRILSLQFDAMKASIGQGLINALTPVLKCINTILAKLSELAAKFAEATGVAFGKQDMSGTSDAMDDVSQSASNATDNVSGIGDAAQKSAKKAEKAMMSFDKINKISDSSNDSGSSGKTASVSGSSIKTTASDQAVKKSGGALDGLKKKFETLQKLFAKGFKLGAGNISGAVNSIKNHLKSIGNSLKEIFTDKNVSDAFKKMVALFVVNKGKIVGAIASIGATIADNLLGGFDLFLQGNKDKIKQWMVKMFNISGEIANIKGNFAAAIADIFSVFQSTDAKKLTAGLFTIIYSAFSGSTELFLKIGREILNLITQPIIQNKDKVKKELESLIKASESVVGGISNIVQGIFEKLNEVYDNSLKPFVDKVSQIISGLIGIVLDAYNKYISPVIIKLGKKFNELASNQISPAIKKMIGAVGSIVDYVKTAIDNIWTFLKPFVTWVVDKISRVIAPAIQGIGNIFMTVAGTISDIVGGLFDVLSGMFDMLTGLFSGNFEKVKEGAEKFASGIWSAIKGVFNGVKEFFGTIFTTAWNIIKSIFSPEGAGKFFSSVWTAIKNKFTSTKEFFGKLFSSAWSAVKYAFSLEGVKAFFGNVWSGIKGAFGSVANWFKETFSGAWEKVKDVFCTGGKVFDGIKSGISAVFKTVVNKLISGINTVIAVPFKAINDMLNKIHDVGIGDIKPFSGLWGKNPISAPQIPQLATGGYVRKNTPQLAMIGDNRHQGEVVAPEDKMLDMAKQAAEMAGSDGMTARVIELLSQILQVLKQMDLILTIDGKVITKEVVRNINQNTLRTGHLEIIVR